MPQVNIGVPHQLGQDEALRRLKEKVESLQATYGAQAKELSLEWADNVLQFTVVAMGLRITGTTTVAPSEVRVHAEIPLAAMPFRGVVERRVKDDLGQMLV